MSDQLSTPIRVRQTDPPDYDEAARRQRAVDPRYWPGVQTWDLQLQWGNKKMNVRGLAITFVFIAAVNIAAVLWSGYQTKVAVAEIIATFSAQLNVTAKKNTEEHQALRRATDRNTCILALPLGPAREDFLRRSGQPGAWGAVCPFIHDE